MKLTKLKLRNFRCYGIAEGNGGWTVIDISKFTAFVGANSSGKSAAFAALEKLFSESDARRVVHKSDFHVNPGEKSESVEGRELSIEAVFEFDELGTPRKGELSVPPFFDALLVEESGATPYMRIRMDATWTKSNLVEGSVERRYYYVASPESAANTEEDEMRITLRRAEIERIQLIYIPAFRDTEDQVRNSGSTLMHQMLKGVNWTDDVRDKVIECFKKVDRLFYRVDGVRLINQSLKNLWSIIAPSTKFNFAEVHFDSGDLQQAVRNSAVYFSPAEDGGLSSVDSIGDGHKSLFYIAMALSLVSMQQAVRSETMNRQQMSPVDMELPALSIIAVEEPENHVAPHLLGKVMEALKHNIKANDAQAIIASHSASIIGRIEPDEVRYFRFDHEIGASSVRRLTLPLNSIGKETERYVRCGVKAYPELYYAKLVVLCEGDSERIVLPRLFEVMTGRSIDAASVSIVPLGGRHVNHFWRLLYDLKIPFVTLLDFDRERYGGAWGRVKYALDQLLENGVKRESLLRDRAGAVLSESEFKALGNKSCKEKGDLDHWIDRLKEYNVYFSCPLDIDWLMLNAFPAAYKALDDGATGPDPHRDITSVNKAVLKGHGGDGGTYKAKEKETMRWYEYLFLGKGKPVVHAMALTRIGDDEIRRRCPRCLRSLVRGAQRLLK